MIRLSGLQPRTAEHPDGDIEIEFQGLRPGEKLYEELLIGNDPITTAHPRIMMASEALHPWATLNVQLEKLKALVARHDAAGVRALLIELVPEYSAGALTVWVVSSRKAGQTSGARKVAAGAWDKPAPMKAV